MKLNKLMMLFILGSSLSLAGCVSLTGGGKVTELNPDEAAEKISTDLDLNDFKVMAKEVATKMLTNQRIFKNGEEYKVSIGAVRNLTENERLRVSDIVGLIKETLLEDERVRIFAPGESFYVMHTELKSNIIMVDSAKAVDYELRFELYNFETNEYLGSWSAQKRYIQSGRSLF